MTRIPVILRAEKETRYDICLSSGLLHGIGGVMREIAAGAQTIAVVTDDTVKTLYAPGVCESIQGAGFRSEIFSIPPGEASKNSGIYLALLDWLAQNKMTRSDAIVALGGGVVGDLAGFAAATYMRGISLAQVPTTLLAMVDSSVGGKTAIDLPSGKNLAGAFYQPSVVLCDPDVLATLPPETFSDGCAEVVKYGMIRPCGILETLADIPIRQQLAQTIQTCVTIKRDIVQADEFDAGERQLLNFGHTIGHAIEHLSRYEVSHGRAVAIGMSIITRAAVRKSLCPPECQTALERALAQCGLPIRAGFPPQAIFEAALNDKKRSGSMITEIIPRSPGSCDLRKMPAADLAEWIEAGLEP
ncbi:MAG: 3-dehydroquinate synthase [Treponema sp.]|nr:3-dehydroquinate synthase [Treponema sp.]